MGFWMFLTIFFLVDSYLYDKGHDTFFWSHKTDAEKEMQKVKLARLQNGKEN